MTVYEKKLSDDFFKLHGTKNYKAVSYKVFLSRLQKYLDKNNCTINSQLYVAYLKDYVISIEKEIKVLKKNEGENND